MTVDSLNQTRNETTRPCHELGRDATPDVSGSLSEHPTGTGLILRASLVAFAATGGNWLPSHVAGEGMDSGEGQRSPRRASTRSAT